MFILQILRFVLEDCQISIIELFGGFLLRCSDYWKMHLKIKKMKIDIFIHASSPTMPNSPPGFYHHRHGDTNYSFTAGSIF